MQNTSNPKFWALIGFGVGALLAAGGADNSVLDSLTGGAIQGLLWFGLSYVILKSKRKKSKD
jgi:hypothetical protein